MGDLVVLQEISGDRQLNFFNQLGPTFLPYRLRGRGCVIMSTSQLTELARGRREGHRGFLSARLEVKGKPVIVTSIHLDSETESKRLSELEHIVNRLSVFEGSHVWAGDFNSLTWGDYTISEWYELRDKRMTEGLEAPQLAISFKMAELEFTDCWADFGRYGCKDTSQLGSSHVDYIYINEEMKKNFCIKDLRHLAMGPSDHRPVVAAFKQREEPLVTKDSMGSYGAILLDILQEMKNQEMDPNFELWKVFHSYGWGLPSIMEATTVVNEDGEFKIKVGP